MLQKFCNASSQIISTYKSRTWFLPTTPWRMKTLIAGIFDIPTTTQIDTYLGARIFTTRHTAIAYQFLVDKIKKRIAGWQAKYITMAGKATLIKSSVASIPLYAMQTTLLSQKVSRTLDRYNCKFLWGDTN